MNTGAVLSSIAVVVALTIYTVRLHAVRPATEVAATSCTRPAGQGMVGTARGDVGERHVCWRGS